MQMRSIQSRRNAMIHLFAQLPIWMPTSSNYPCWCGWNENTYTSHMLAMLAILVPQVLWNKRIPFRTWTGPMKMRRMTLRVGESHTYNLQVLAMGFSHWILFRSSICPLRPLVSASPMRPFVANWLASTRVLLSQLSGIPNRYDFSVQDPWWI